MERGETSSWDRLGRIVRSFISNIGWKRRIPAQLAKLNWNPRFEAIRGFETISNPNANPRRFNPLVSLCMSFPVRYAIAVSQLLCTAGNGPTKK